MITLNEYTVKKHILTLFVIVSAGILAGIYFQSEKLSDRLSLESFSEDLELYTDDIHQFSVSYPVLRYTVQGERVPDALNIYFTSRRGKDRDQATSIHIEDGTRNDYVQKLLAEPNRQNVISERSIKIGGNNIAAKQLVFGVTKKDGFDSIPEGETWRFIETIFSRNNEVFTVRQLYNKTLDQIHPLLLTSLKFQ